MPVTPADYVAAIDAALAICEARLAACDAATPGPWDYCGHATRDRVCKCRNLFGDAGKVFVARCFQLTDWPDDPDPTPDQATADANVRFIAAARTDHPASLRRDIAGLQAHRDAEVKLRRRGMTNDEHDDLLAQRSVHCDYSQRVFADCGVKVGGNDETA